LLEWVVFALFLLTPLADISVGALAMAAGLSTGYDSEQKLVTLLPGMAFRGILLLFLVYLLWKRQKFAVLIGGGVITLVFALSEAIAMIQHQSLGEFIYGGTYVFKLVLIFVVFFYIATADVQAPLLRNGARVIRFSFAAYAFAIAIGHLTGFEYVTYGGLGSSGLMIQGSANSISLIMLVGSGFIADAIARSENAKQRLWWSLVLASGFYSAALLLTKGAMLGVLLPTAAYAARALLNGRSPLPWLFGMIGLLAASVLILVIDWNEVRIVKRFLDVIEYHGGDVVSALFNGRLDFFVHGWSAFSEIYRPYEWLIGAGAAGARDAVGLFSGVTQGVESDFFDIGLVYGLLGFSITVILWLCVIKRALSVSFRPASAITHVLAFDIFLLTGLTIVAGHVLTSGLGGAILGLGIGLLFRQPALPPEHSTTLAKVGN